MSSTSTVTSWLQAAGRFPLLTAEQEIQLSHQIRRGMAEGATPQQQRIGARAKQKVIQSNLKLVVAIAKKFSVTCNTSAAINLEDLMQEGCIGLNRAAEKYDPTTGYKFSTYAFWWISQSITRLIDNTKSTVRLPNQVGQMANRVRKAPASITTRAELQEWLGASDSQMASLEQGLALRRMGSLDAALKVGDGEGSTVMDLVADHNNQPDLDALDWELAAEAIDAALDPDDERVEILKRRTMDGVTYQVIASERGKSREAVRQRVSTLLKEKRDQLSHLKQFLAA